MRNIVTVMSGAVLGIALSALAGVASGCEIVNAQQIDVGADQGIQGACSNNGAPITCSYEEGEGWTCDGPQGSYAESTLEAVVNGACGCQ